MYFYELAGAALKLVNDMLELKPGETFIITADTESDMDVVNATASAAFAIGAKPMVITYPAPPNVGKADEHILPGDALVGALLRADVWVEFNNKWMIFSTPFEQATAENQNLRYLNLTGMNADMMTRLIGRVDQKSLSAFMHAVVDMIRDTGRMRITTPAGTDLEFEMNPENTLFCDDGKANVPGVHMLIGQICFIPKLSSINGRLVFEGSICPVPGVIHEPVDMKIEKGVICEIKGGATAEAFKEWLNSFNDPAMFRLAQGCLGLNPGGMISGNVLDGERVWGSTEWGIGHLSAYESPKEHFDGPSHTDGLCLRSSIWLDDRQIMDLGKFVEPRLKAMALDLGME